MQHAFKGEHSYVLVRTSKLPDNYPDVYVEINTRPTPYDRGEDYDSDDSEEASEASEASEDSEDSDESQDSRVGEKNYGFELKIRVYNQTVEFKRDHRLVVSFNLSSLSVLLKNNFLRLMSSYLSLYVMIWMWNVVCCRSSI